MNSQARSAPVAAMAQGDETPTALERLIDEILNILIPIFVGFIGALTTWLLKKLSQRIGASLSDATVKAWADLARKAALRGAEWARQQVKQVGDGGKVPGPAIMEKAASWATDVARALKLPDIGRDRLEALIEAELFAMRTGEEV